MFCKPFSPLNYRTFRSLEKGKFVFQKSFSETPFKPDQVSFCTPNLLTDNKGFAPQTPENDETDENDTQAKAWFRKSRVCSSLTLDFAQCTWVSSSQGKENNTNMNFLFRLSQGHWWPLRLDAQATKRFLPTIGAAGKRTFWTKNFGADVHDFRCERLWLEGLSKNAFALMFWPLSSFPLSILPKTQGRKDQGSASLEKNKKGHLSDNNAEEECCYCSSESKCRFRGVIFCCAPGVLPLHKRRGILSPPVAFRGAFQKNDTCFPLFCCVCDLWTSVTFARVQGEVPRELPGAREIPSDTKLLLTKNYFEIIIFGKLRISRVISWKCLSFLDISRAPNPSKIMKNNSQGTIFVIISCQRVPQRKMTLWKWHLDALELFPTARAEDGHSGGSHDGGFAWRRVASRPWHTGSSRPTYRFSKWPYFGPPQTCVYRALFKG